MSTDEPDSGGGEVSEQLPDVAGTSKLNADDLGNVLEAVHDAHSQWYGIGLQLRLASAVLEGIEQQYSRTEDMLREMLKQWLKQVDPVPSWVALIEALRSKTVNEPSLAEQLEKHHISPLPHGILTHTVSNITDHHKQILGRLQATTKEVDSQLESYGEILQQSKKVDPSDETPEDAKKGHIQRVRVQSDITGLKTEPERELHTQLKRLMSRIAGLLEEKKTEEPGLSQMAVPEETMIKELDPLKDEMDRLRACSSELEEELHSLKAKLVELEEKNALLSTEKEDLSKEKLSFMTKIVEKDDEIAKKAKDVAEKSADYTSLHVEMEQLKNEAQKLAEENKLLKSQLQSLDEMPPPEIS